jgi:hypothetical protein
MKKTSSTRVNYKKNITKKRHNTSSLTKSSKRSVNSIKKGKSFQGSSIKVNEEQMKKCKKFAKKMTNLGISLRKMFPPKDKKFISKDEVYKKMLKQVCNTNKCMDMEDEGVFKEDVVNGFNKKYNKKTIKAFRKLGVISFCK